MKFPIDKTTAISLSRDAGKEIGKGALSAVGSLIVYAIAIWLLAYYFVSGKKKSDADSAGGTQPASTSYLERAIALRTPALSTSLATNTGQGGGQMIM